MFAFIAAENSNCIYYSKYKKQTRNTQIIMYFSSFFLYYQLLSYVQSKQHSISHNQNLFGQQQTDAVM